jgi:hypothetical protein
MVTIRGVTGVTPLNGAWMVGTEGECTAMGANGPASARIDTPAGPIDVDVPQGRTVEIKITGDVAVVTYS